MWLYLIPLIISSIVVSEALSILIPKFKKREEVKQKESKVKKVISEIKINKISKKVKEESADIPSNKVYLFSLLLEAITRLVKLICYITIFCLTSVGLTILVNPELRELVFQVFGLK